MSLSIETLALAKKYAKSYTDSSVSQLPKGFVYKGAVNYYSNLPNNAEIGDTYTVKYAGSSGTDPDGFEYAWGNYEGTNQWIKLGGESVPPVDASQNGKILGVVNGAYGITDGIPFLTTAPTSDNTDGTIKIVHLSAEPGVKYQGYLYFIDEV